MVMVRMIPAPPMTIPKNACAAAAMVSMVFMVFFLGLPPWFWVVCLILVHVLFLFKFGNFVVGVGFSVIIFRFDFCVSNTPSNIQLKLKPKI